LEGRGVALNRERHAASSDTRQRSKMLKEVAFQTTNFISEGEEIIATRAKRELEGMIVGVILFGISKGISKRTEGGRETLAKNEKGGASVRECKFKKWRVII